MRFGRETRESCEEVEPIARRGGVRGFGERENAVTFYESEMGQ